MKMKAIIDESEDSVIVFTNKMGYNMNKHISREKKTLTLKFQFHKGAIRTSKTFEFDFFILIISIP